MVCKTAKATLTPIELNHGETLCFTRADGVEVKLKLLHTAGEVVSTDMPSLDAPISRARTVYRFWAEVELDGVPHRLEREVPTQRSFYEPWEVGGLRIWFDSAACIFKAGGGFLMEKDAKGVGMERLCMPNKDARFAVQDMALDICPEVLHPWMPLPVGGLRIEDCYRGEDCWMGTYDGICAHGGLDINHEVGLPLYAPFALDEQYYFNSLAAGDLNNRWRGIRRWDARTTWIIQAHHMIELVVPEHTPLARGEQFARGAGVYSGEVHHSHFVFRIEEDGETFFLDPWILFWRMFQEKNREGF